MGVARDVYLEVLKHFPGSRITRIGAEMKWSQDDINALIEAGKAGGEYVDTLGKKTEDMTYEEYMTFIEVIVTAWIENSIPF